MQVWATVTALVQPSVLSTAAGVQQQANTDAAPNNNGNSNVLNNGVQSSNNAIVFGVAHSF